MMEEKNLGGEIWAKMQRNKQQYFLVGILNKFTPKQEKFED